MFHPMNIPSSLGILRNGRAGRPEVDALGNDYRLKTQHLGQGVRIFDKNGNLDAAKAERHYTANMTIQFPKQSKSTGVSKQRGKRRGYKVAGDHTFDLRQSHDANDVPDYLPMAVNKTPNLQDNPLAAKVNPIGATRTPQRPTTKRKENNTTDGKVYNHQIRVGNLDGEARQSRDGALLFSSPSPDLNVKNPKRRQ